MYFTVLRCHTYFIFTVLWLLSYLPICCFCCKAQLMGSNTIFGNRPKWHSDLKLIWRIRRLCNARHREMQLWCNIEFGYSGKKKSYQNIKHRFQSKRIDLAFTLYLLSSDLWNLTFNLPKMFYFKVPLLIHSGYVA